MTPTLFSSLKVLTILPTKQKTEINETKNKQFFKFLQNYLVTVVQITAHQSSLPMLRSRESWRD